MKSLCTQLSSFASSFSLLAAVAVCFCFSSDAAAIVAASPQADLQIVEERGPEGTREIYKMTVTPAAQPVPAMKHRFTVMPHETVPGNAVTHYLRSYGEGYLRRQRESIDNLLDLEQFNNVFNGDAPSEELPLEKIKEFNEGFENYFENYLKKASLCRDIDWGLEEEGFRGKETLSFLLPTVQEFRGNTRLLMVRARYQISQGQYEKAIETLRVNFKLAEIVSDVKLIVNGLVATAQVNIGNRIIAELIAADDSPNLYWAIAELKDPVINFRDAMRTDLSMGLRLFPVLIDAETTTRSSAEWGQTYRELCNSLAELSTDMAPPDMALPDIAASLAFVNYPSAKRRLIASGMDQDVVEQMPVGQVLVLDTRREFLILADEIESSIYLPREQADRRVELADGQLRSRANLGNVLAGIVTPAVTQIRNAELRTRRDLKALQAIEAIRMHLAETGEFPKTLDEIKVIYVPDNPATGKPFAYWMDGETAVLDLPFSDGVVSPAQRFEIQLADKK